MHKVDNKARSNVWLNGKSLGQIRPNEYIIVNLKDGDNHFKILHIDLVNMRSEHNIEVNNETKIIKINPTLGSYKLEVTNGFPKILKSFKYAELR